MVNDSTRGYSVYVTDENNTVQGSGVLFYDGGDTMFVFTCAHVVEGLEKVRLFILRELMLRLMSMTHLSLRFRHHRLELGRKCIQHLVSPMSDSYGQ